MAGGKSSADSYWPGFVDALTNVVIAMIFVVVVLAISLAFAAQLMGKKIAERIIKEHEAKQVQTAPRAPPSAEADMRSAESLIEGRIRIPVAGNESASAPAGGKLRDARNVLQLDFTPQALTLDDAAVTAFKGALAKLGPDTSKKRAALVGRGPAMAMSDNQRAAYMRVMATRNVLIENGFPPERISVRIDTETDAPGASVSVTFTE